MLIISLKLYLFGQDKELTPVLDPECLWQMLIYSISHGQLHDEISLYFSLAKQGKKSPSALRNENRLLFTMTVSEYSQNSISFSFLKRH